MQSTRQIPLTRDLVLIGGGHTHALVLRRWGMHPLPGARLTLINPEPTAPYTGMLPGHIAGHYLREALEIDLVRLARFAGARLILGRVDGIDRAARRITVPGRPDVAYDLASINVGITSAMPDLPGFARHGTGAKPLGPFADRWQQFLIAAAAGQVPAQVIVIGGGVAGVELSLACAERLNQQHTPCQVSVIEAEAHALTGVAPAARRILLARMASLGVSLRTGVTPVRVEATGVTLSDGSTLPAGFVIGAARGLPQSWLAATGLDLTNGFITVTRNLQSANDPALFAAGDCAHLAHAPRPKAGVFAVREAPVLHHNLRAALMGRPLRAFHPQRAYLKLISTGGKSAVADKFRLTLSGAWLWRIKDRIDRRFMDKLADLSRPRPRVPPADHALGVAEALGTAPLCGGCGAKVGSGALAAMLARLPATRRADVLSGPGDDAAILTHGQSSQVITTDHLRDFWPDPWLMARISAIHALGDVWAMGATPQVALAQIILPLLSPTLQSRSLAEIMAAATDVFTAAGADMVGGHTSQGAELTLGFTVTGLTPTAAIRKSGASPGDSLILTKPLGTGVILAAEMALAAPGHVVAAALASMARAQTEAAAILAPHAHAMTDITGFGLAGHLMEMLDAAGLAAIVDLTAIPLLPGAGALAAQGYRSSLYPTNRAVAARMALPATPAADLLFDPQTAGGLLAAVPADMAATLLARLHRTDPQAAIIGTLTRGAPFLTVTVSDA